MFEVFGAEQAWPPTLGGPPEMLQPDAFCEHIMQQNATAARAPPRTPLGKLTALPRPPIAGFKTAASWRGVGRETGKWTEGEGRGGEKKDKGGEGQGGRRRGGKGR